MIWWHYGSASFIFSMIVLHLCRCQDVFTIVRQGMHADSFTLTNDLCIKYQNDSASVCGRFSASVPLWPSSQCECICNDKSRTFGFYQGGWKCTDDRRVRQSSDCKVSALGKIETIHSTSGFFKNVDCSTSPNLPTRLPTLYQECNGSWTKVPSQEHVYKIVLSHHDGYKDIFYLQKVDNKYNGRVIHGSFTCTNSVGRRKKHCVLFKMSGSLNCPMQNIFPTVPTTVTTFLRRGASQSEMASSLSTTSVTTSTPYLLAPSSSDPSTVLSTTNTMTITPSKLMSSAQKVPLSPSKVTPSLGKPFTIATSTAVVIAVPSKTITPTTSSSQTTPTEPSVDVPGGKNQQQSGSDEVPLIAGVVASAAVFVVCVVGGIVCYKRRRTPRTGATTESTDYSQRNMAVPHDDLDYALPYNRHPPDGAPLEDLYTEPESILNSSPEQDYRTSGYGDYYETPIEEQTREPMYHVVEGPKSEGIYDEGANQAYTDEHLSHSEPTYHVLEGPNSELGAFGEGTNEADMGAPPCQNDPMYQVIEGPTSDGSFEEGENQANKEEPIYYNDPKEVINEPMYNVLEDSNNLSAGQAEDSPYQGIETVTDDTYRSLQQPGTYLYEELQR